MTIRACVAAAFAFALLPGAAGAATVSVSEETLGTFPPGERATLVFVSAAGEDNIATVAPAGEENGKVRYEVRDLHAPLTAGAGCTGGGGPDTAATCLLPRSRPRSCQHLGCSDLGSEIIFRFTLGDGNDELRATLLPADDGGGGKITLEANAGVGDDQLYPGATNDILDPGPGADTVRSNQGDDFVDAGDAPDGADHYDLREGFDTISYLRSSQPVNVLMDSVANDGPVGEGDLILDAEEVVGTRGADSLWGDDDAEALRGAGGGDALIGNGGNDLLDGTPLGFGLPPPPFEDDTMRGGTGNDRLSGAGGDDWASAGPGNDELYLGAGEDLGDGGNGADFIDGGEDADRLAGRRGRDRLYAGTGLYGVNDGAADKVHCGPSRRDHAFNVETRDRVEGCERVKSGIS